MLFFFQRSESRQCHTERLTGDGGAPLQGILERIARLVPRFPTSRVHSSFNRISALGFLVRVFRVPSLRCFSLLQQLHRVLVYPPRPVLRVCHPSSSMLPGYIIIVERHAKTSKPWQISLKLACVLGIQCLIKPSSKQPMHTLAIFSGCGNFYTPHSSSTVSFVFFDNHVKRNSIVQSICYYSAVSLLLFCLIILSFFHLNSTCSA